MCISLKNEELIKIQAKTDEFKYEFLRRYIPLWNKIILDLFPQCLPR